MLRKHYSCLHGISMLVRESGLRNSSWRRLLKCSHPAGNLTMHKDIALLNSRSQPIKNPPKVRRWIGTIFPNDQHWVRTITTVFLERRRREPRDRRQWRQSMLGPWMLAYWEASERMVLGFGWSSWTCTRWSRAGQWWDLDCTVESTGHRCRLWMGEWAINIRVLSAT